MTKTMLTPAVIFQRFHTPQSWSWYVCRGSSEKYHDAAILTEALFTQHLPPPPCPRDPRVPRPGELHQPRLRPLRPLQGRL